MSRKLVSLVLLVVLVGLAACTAGGGQGATSQSEPIKIGAIFDLSGATADVGTPYADGVQGYVKWLNAQGGINGRPIELLFQDYAYKVDVAEQLYSQFVQEGAVAFMGWGTGDTEALRGKVAENKIPFMSASYSHVLGDPAEAPYNFLVGTSYSDQFVSAMKWILEDWKAKGSAGAPIMAFLHHPSPFGLSPWQQGGEEWAKANGIQATAYEMPQGATDYTAELTRIKDSGAAYVVLQTVSSPASTALKNAKSLGLDGVTFVCLNWCADENLVNLAGDAAEGVVGAIPFTPPSVTVPGMKDADDYLKSQGSSLQDKGLHYIQGWVTIGAMVEGIKKVLADGKPVNGENVKTALETLSNYETGGVTAPITLTPTDHRGSKALKLFKVENGQWQQLTDFVSAK